MMPNVMEWVLALAEAKLGSANELLDFEWWGFLDLALAHNDRQRRIKVNREREAARRKVARER